MRAMPQFAQAVAGAACTVLFAALVYLGTQYALGTFDERYEVDVVLGELGQGIITGSDVRIRDVLVGEVGAIRLDDEQRAVVTLSLDPSFRIPERALFQTNARTLLGEKQVEVVFDGAVEDGPFLSDGAVVSDDDRVVEFQDVMATLSDLLAAVQPEDLSVLVNEGLGAFEGQGPAIARAVDQGARATGTLRRSLDDQVASQRDLSLLAERLGPEGETFNRMGRELVRGLPTVSDNEQPLVGLLDELVRFSRVLNATLTVDRESIDRLIVEGDSVTRMLFTYSTEVGEVVTGLVQYTSNYVQGFMDESFDGEAARFQALIDPDDVIAAELCEELPPEVAAEIPLCGGIVTDLLRGVPAVPAPSLPEAPAAGSDGPRELLVPPGAFRPQVPRRLAVDEVARRLLPAAGEGATP